jgi:quinoprotein glucose dehydrogenase
MAETKTQRSGILVILTALFAAFCGLYLLIGGVWLVSLAVPGTTLLPGW